MLLASPALGQAPGSSRNAAPGASSAQAQAPSDAPGTQKGSPGKILFSRSADDNAKSEDEKTHLPARSAAETAAPDTVKSITDAQRAAPAFLSYDFTVHLEPSAAAIAVQLRTTIRNDGAAPLTALPLQLGSSLHFEHVRLGEKALPFAEHVIESDADHTGSLTEVAIVLPAPLAPGATVNLVIDYAGTIPASTGRLDRLGAPPAIAARTDWDQIGEDFTGLRGFGDSVWYPVASVPALLGDGAALFHEIGRQKLRNAGATVSMAVTEEFTGNAPNLAVIDGKTIAMPGPASMPAAGFPGVSQVALTTTRLGFDALSLVLASRVPAASSPLLAVGALPSHAEAAEAYRAAADLLQPLFKDWLGEVPDRPLLLIDLPTEGSSPSQDGDALLLSMRSKPASQLAEELSAPLTHAWFHSPRAWLSEGVPGLMTVLWTERTQGRDRALEQLAGQRDALSLAEPSSPGISVGQPLLSARDSVYYRTKATYVLWMLRSIVGDAALGEALRTYDPEKDTTPEYFQKLLEQAVARVGGPQGVPGAAAGTSAGAPQSDTTPTGVQRGTQVGTASTPLTGALPGQAEGTAQDGEPNPGDLGWFFRNWVDDDPGLPDLAITNVYSSKTGAGDQWLVSLNLSNTGYAEAEVPVVVHSASTSVALQVRVPARGTLSRRVLLLGQPTEVDVNDGSVPEVEASVHQRLIQ